jgi:hypothetical protein
MRKFVLLAFCLPLFLSSFAQSNENKVKYVYSSCTDEAKKELFELLKDDKVKLKEIYVDYNLACESGKIVLSTDQSTPIATIINKFKPNNNKGNSEAEIYAKIAREKYVLVTNLIN